MRIVTWLAALTCPDHVNPSATAPVGSTITVSPGATPVIGTMLLVFANGKFTTPNVKAGVAEIRSVIGVEFAPLNVIDFTLAIVPSEAMFKPVPVTTIPPLASSVVNLPLDRVVLPIGVLSKLVAVVAPSVVAPALNPASVVAPVASSVVNLPLDRTVFPIGVLSKLANVVAPAVNPASVVAPVAFNVVNLTLEAVEFPIGVLSKLAAVVAPSAVAPAVKPLSVDAPVTLSVVNLPLDAIVAPIGALSIDPPVIALPEIGMPLSVPLAMLLAFNAVKFVPTPLKLVPVTSPASVTPNVVAPALVCTSNFFTEPASVAEPFDRISLPVPVEVTPSAPSAPTVASPVVSVPVVVMF